MGNTIKNKNRSKMGLGQSSIEAELAKFSTGLEKGSKLTYPKISEIYGTSSLVSCITNCLINDTVYDIDRKKNVDNNPTILFLHSEKSEILKAAFSPLLKFLVTTKAKYSIKDKSLYLNLDTLRKINSPKNFVLVDLSLNIGTTISNKPLFDLVVAFIKYGSSSEGVRSSISTTLKDRIAQLYGKKCFACCVDLDSWEAGHILSVAHGGLTTVDNLRPLCFQCNRKMSAMHMYEFIVKGKLPGIKNLNSRERKAWKAIVNLTILYPHLEKLPVHLRLTKIGKEILT